MGTEIASLAPAAGAGIGKIIADRLLAEPGFIDKMVHGLLTCLNATQRRWDKESDAWLIDPDFQTILKTVFGILAHMEGEPIKRIIHAHLGGGGEVNPLAALQESPALREAARALLDKADWKEKHASGGMKRAKKAQAAEAEPVPGNGAF